MSSGDSTQRKSGNRAELPIRFCHRRRLAGGGHNDLMADPPAFRTGYMSILLPVETGEGEVRRVIRESVIRALAAAGEWPIRVDVVTSTGSDDGQTKRWFVEYETGPYGQAIDQPDQCG